MPQSGYAASYTEAVTTNMKEYTLRRATEGDFYQLLRIRNQVLRKYIEYVRGWDEEREEQRFRRNFDAATTRVILSDGRVIGFLGVREEHEALYLAQAYIIPEYQGRGIGTALIRKVLSRGRPVELYVMKLNTGAIRLYERLGFRLKGEEKDDYRMRAEPPA